MTEAEKLRLFDELKTRLSERLADADDDAEKRLVICAYLQAQVPHYDWVGYYFVSTDTERMLRLIEYSGEPTDHTLIPFGKGICGQSAETEQMFVVDDVSAESNYLSCSPNVRSEIVLPLMRDGKYVGQLDIDSHLLAAFTEADVAFLQWVCEQTPAPHTS